jgi:hypothetical protein
VLGAADLTMQNIFIAASRYTIDTRFTPTS